MDPGNAARLGELLLELLNTHEFVHFSDDGEGGCAISYLPRGSAPDAAWGRVRALQRRTPEDALEAALGVVPVRTCLKCGQTKPLSDYSLQADCPRGHMSRCKSCERERYKKYPKTRLRKYAEPEPEAGEAA